MTAHKHAAMIKAKADNMDLVVFTKNSQNDGKWWALVSDKSIVPSFDGEHYFACLPKHKEACLHWLSGGSIEYQDFPTNEWSTIWNGCVFSWSVDSVFMQEEFNIRIKPRKENRWIGVFKSKSLLSGKAEYHNTELSYESVDELKRDVHAPHGFNGWQFIEIEVEI